MDFTLVAYGVIASSLWWLILVVTRQLLTRRSARRLGYWLVVADVWMNRNFGDTSDGRHLQYPPKP